jgi:hypothetical protein
MKIVSILSRSPRKSSLGKSKLARSNFGAYHSLKNTAVPMQKKGYAETFAIYKLDSKGIEKLNRTLANWFRCEDYVKGTEIIDSLFR